MSETDPNEFEIPARGKLSHPFMSIGNEVFDLFLPIMGADCFAVYAYFVRKHHSDHTLKHDIRNLGKSCGLSASTASRACEVLEHFPLVKLHRFKGSRKSECQLFDSWEVAKRLGGEFDPKSKSYRFPAQVSERLQSEVREIRERHQVHGKTATEARIPCGNLPLHVSSRNTNVSPEKRLRAIRETQTGIHLIQKEERSEKSLTPTPVQNDSDTIHTANTHSDKDDPDVLLRWARMRFTGVIDDMRKYLLNTNAPSIPRFRNQFQDWEEFGFGRMAIEGARMCGAILVLTISAPDPERARRGLAKYHRTWDASTANWFEGEVRFELVDASRKE